MGSSHHIYSTLWLNNSYAVIKINQIAKAKIKVLLKNLRFVSYLYLKTVLNQSGFRQC
jgi:hypothetical protein